ncbi:LuxR C-terminal-related transcriptional regulator [Streptomyces hygroscopicus]|uniref:LuxR C-terminal-related transcriptional regulator n=1 Tax=Streptomyces hygroscopicus TaxID=1912 RepID=UPI003D766F81
MWKLKRLTAREREALLLVGAGVGNRERERSRELEIAERKATAHIACIVEKLGQRSRLQVAALAAVLPGSTGPGSPRARVAVRGPLLCAREGAPSVGRRPEPHAASIRGRLRPFPADCGRPPTALPLGQ